MRSIEAIERIVKASAACRMSDPFDQIAGVYEGLVVAGASGLVADHTLKGLSKLGIRPVALIDNNANLWGTSTHDVVVLPPHEAIARYPKAVYVASVFTHTPLRRQISTLGASRVVSYAHLFQKYPSAFLPYFAVDDPSAIADHAEAVQRTADVWADEESYLLYIAILNWFVTLDSDAVPPPLPAGATYFPSMLKPRADEVFVDCGAFDGDTLLRYVVASSASYKNIFAFEPDPRTFARLSACVARLHRAQAIHAAVGAKPGSLRFVASGAPSSHASSAGARGLDVGGRLVEVDVIRLDDVAPRPTFVKMDIEGFEQEALEGALDLLSGGDTAFAITLYHRMSDLWQLPLFIHDRAPDLRLFLRHYAEDWAETICYAIPADRINRSSHLSFAGS